MDGHFHNTTPKRRIIKKKGQSKLIRTWLVLSSRQSFLESALWQRRNKNWQPSHLHLHSLRIIITSRMMRLGRHLKILIISFLPGRLLLLRRSNIFPKFMKYLLLYLLLMLQLLLITLTNHLERLYQGRYDKNNFIFF